MYVTCVFSSPGGVPEDDTVDAEVIADLQNRILETQRDIEVRANQIQADQLITFKQTGTNQNQADRDQSDSSRQRPITFKQTGTNRIQAGRGQSHSSRQIPTTFKQAEASQIQAHKDLAISPDLTNHIQADRNQKRFGDQLDQVGRGQSESSKQKRLQASLIRFSVQAENIQQD